MLFLPYVSGTVMNIYGTVESSRSGPFVGIERPTVQRTELHVQK
jgi:hypothetical protein